MPINILLFYLLLGCVELYTLYKKQGRSKEIIIYTSIFSLAIILTVLALYNLIPRNFATIIKFW